eukprot:TRINITY_DN2160_c1_g1_i2.p3 TRINITY_DN2160_c1_g1~~TRINITY_DN2160_c1_g1_i2.p3  ORF type:complete len:130 (+),score=15.78 TRINITY_DN2160_c1_g1_i2:172-561(+)
MKQFLTTVLVLNFILYSVIAQRGGITTIDLDEPMDEETWEALQAAAKFAVDEINKQINSGELLVNVPTPLAFWRIEKAGSSIVAGTKWHMTISTIYPQLEKYYLFDVEVVDAPFAPEPLTLVYAAQFEP